MRLCVRILNGSLCKAGFKTRRSRKATIFLGYDEVRAVKPLPHLGWRDRLDCILCQDDSNLLAQDRGVPDCHQHLENAAELGRSPGKLNRVAESNCAHERQWRCGGRDNTRGGQPHRTFILRGREPIPRCCDRHPIYRWRTELNAGRPVGRTSEITREPDGMFAA